MPFTNKFCVNCNFYRNHQCGAEGSLRHVDPVTGNKLYESATAMRANQNMCAEEGTWFEPKEVEQPWYTKLYWKNNE